MTSELQPPYFPPPFSPLLSCHHGPAAGGGLPGRLDARPVPALPADHGPALHLSQGLPQTSTGEPEPLTATEHDGEGRVRLQGDDHQEGELRVQSTGVAAPGDDEVAIGHLLLPPRQVAEYLSRQHTDPTEMYRRKDLLFASKMICKELMDLLNQDRSPLCNTSPQPILDPMIQRHLTNFSMVTHGFGSPAIVAALTAIQNYMNESIKYLDKIYPSSGLGDIHSPFDSKLILEKR